MKPTAVQNIDECKPISELHLWVTWQDHAIKTMSTRIANACASNILTGRITGTFVTKTLRCSTTLASQLKFADGLPVTAWLHTQQRDFASISQVRAIMLSRSLKKILRQQQGSRSSSSSSSSSSQNTTATTTIFHHWPGCGKSAEVLTSLFELGRNKPRPLLRAKLS